MNASLAFPPAPAAVSRTGVMRLAVALLALSLPALLFPGVIGDAAMGGALLADGRPLQVHDSLLAFVFAPFVAVSAGVLFMAPGLMFTYLTAPARTTDRWIVVSFAVSLMIVSLLAMVGQGLAGDAFRGTTFGYAVVLLFIIMTVVGHWRLPRLATGVRATLPVSSAVPLVLAVCGPLVLGVLFAPKLHWEAFNGDGAHAFEAARLLLVQPLPFFPESAGDIAAFPGITSMLFAFPASWYLRLFGVVDSAVRLPMLLYVPLLVSALAWLISAGRDVVALPAGNRVLIWLAVVSYSVAMAWSATYNPYTADLALPATQDTLLLVVFVGFVAACIERKWLAVVLFATLTYISLPNGLILMAFWLAAMLVVWRPVPWSDALRLAALIVVLVVGGALLPRALALAHLPVPGREYGLIGILRYFAFLRFTDASRLVWTALPSGILPVAAMVLWRRQDPIARALTLVSVAYFLFFFVQANVSFHHFVPSMLLPIAVLWRMVPESGVVRRRWLGAIAVAGVASLALVWPPSAAPQSAGRQVGQLVWSRIDGYEHSAAASLASSSMLMRLFPVDWSPDVPAMYGGSPLVWHRYARHVDDDRVNYIVQRSGDPVPARARVLVDSAGFALYVRSDSVWAKQRRLRPPTPAGSRWLAVPRATLFRTVQPEGDTHVIDVARTLKSLGLPIDAWLDRLGATP